ncbi:MAG TPA: hypothetical protein HPP80_06725 [Rhodospirillaceae bacterium]|nr:hypothetical protein [Rhodospirillaceae bacterium]
MRSHLVPELQCPNFHNHRRQAAIDQLITLGINPFQRMPVLPGTGPSHGDFEDRYLSDVRSMPRLPIEIDWDKRQTRTQLDDLAARISAARSSH